MKEGTTSPGLSFKCKFKSHIQPKADEETRPLWVNHSTAMKFLCNRLDDLLDQ